MKKFLLLFVTITVLFLVEGLAAEHTPRPIPLEWDKLVFGGRFMDRFLPMPKGKSLKGVWGEKSVAKRYVTNGIEDDTVSYWGGSVVKGDDGKYHMFVCGWLESNPDGHMGYKNCSYQYQAICDNPIGPFITVRKLGYGHNTTLFKTKSGAWALYHITGYDIKKDCKYFLFEDGLNGDFTTHNLKMDMRDRPIYPGVKNGFHNMSFTSREDGSVLMVNRGGSIWVSKDGVDTFNQITDGIVYPLVDGRYEDPVVWRDNVQYNMIVNDWYGRTAFYLRSKDGIRWVVDPGQAYMPGYIALHDDGYNEQWYKYERIRIMQDEYGRAVQANFAVIDFDKHGDLPNDNHSSKNISVPLQKGMLLEFMSKELTRKTKTFKVKIKGESDFNVQDIDISSLRFGASSHVNYGRGSKAIKGEVVGKDLVVTFQGVNHCIDIDEFAPKMLGKTKKGDMIFGYSRLPWVNYTPPILSARKPFVKGGKLFVKVENFGESTSNNSMLIIKGKCDNRGYKQWGSVVVPPIEAYGCKEIEVNMDCDKWEQGDLVQISIIGDEGVSVPFNSSIR